MRSLLVLWLGLTACALAACGGASTEGSTTPVAEDSCAGPRAEAAEAQSALDACRREASGGPAWAHQVPYDRALAEVRALAVLAARGRVEPAQAQVAADAYWALLDVVSPELTNHASLDRAENAAEGILRDREGDPAVAAAAEAEQALGALRDALLPDAPPDPCAGPQAEADRTAAIASDCH